MSGAQAWAFYRDVAKNRVVWTIEDEGGYPAPKNYAGVRAQPFWSSRSRVEKIIRNVPAYGSFRPVEIAWSEFESNWVPSLLSDGLLMGVNWSGPAARGYDMPPDRVLASIRTLMDKL